MVAWRAVSVTELGDKKYAGFCFLCGTEMFSRTGPEYYLDPECCIPGTNTHNCEIGSCGDPTDRSRYSAVNQHHSVSVLFKNLLKFDARFNDEQMNGPFYRIEMYCFDMFGHPAIDVLPKEHPLNFVNLMSYSERLLLHRFVLELFLQLQSQYFLLSEECSEVVDALNVVHCAIISTSAFTLSTHPLRPAWAKGVVFRAVAGWQRGRVSTKE